MTSKDKTLLENEGYNPYSKPIQIGRWEATKLAVFNPKNGTVLGRTPRNWGELIIFYTIFYIILAVMFAICMYGLLQSTSPDRPTYELSKSIIGVDPGLGYRPYPQNFEDERSVIWYQAKNAENVRNWTTSLDAFLLEYTKPHPNRVPCDFGKPAPKGKVCNVDVEKFGPCTSKDNYSYDKAKPCIFIKLNRIYNWIPQHFSKEMLPKNDAPAELISAVNSTDQTLIWLTCEGMNEVDKENIGPIEYYPHQGFPTYYYPFTNDPGYLSPLVAVHFKNPIHGILISVECRAWADNIHYSRGRDHAVGSVHIELMVDE